MRTIPFRGSEEPLFHRVLFTEPLFYFTEPLFHGKAALTGDARETQWVGFSDHPIPQSGITRLRDSLEVLAFAISTYGRDGRGRQLAGGAGNGVALFIDLHAQREAHGSKDLLDLIERLATEVLGLEHLRFRLLHQLADGLDVGVLQAVVAANGKLQLFHRAVQVFVLDSGLVFAASLCL